MRTSSARSRHTSAALLCGATLLAAGASAAHAQTYPPPPPPGPVAYRPPPPGYPPQPPPPVEPRLHGFTGNTFIGLNNFLGDYGEGIDTGLRLGTALGYRFGRAFALTGELVIDQVNIADVPDGIDYTAVDVELSAVGTFYVPIGGGELQLAGKLGRLGGAASYDDGFRTFDTTMSGTVLGFNAGMAFRVGPRLSLGPLLMIDYQHVEEVCLEMDGVQQCSSRDELRSGTVASLMFALWY